MVGTGIAIRDSMIGLTLTLSDKVSVMRGQKVWDPNTMILKDNRDVNIASTGVSGGGSSDTIGGGTGAQGNSGGPGMPNGGSGSGISGA